MSREEAAKLQQNYVGVEHILLALLLEREAWPTAFCATSAWTRSSFTSA